jgi:TetR/AcrR family transcriptional regulator, transcriptional repressor for nem operon
MQHSPLCFYFRSVNQGWRADAGGKLPSGIDPDDLATTLLATLQGGLLLAQVQRSTRPFETAVDTLLALAIGR